MSFETCTPPRLSSPWCLLTPNPQPSTPEPSTPQPNREVNQAHEAGEAAKSKADSALAAALESSAKLEVELTNQRERAALAEEARDR